MEKQQNGFVKGAFVLSLGGMAAKILGAVYRIPLTNLLGSYGIGIYQLVFPMYTLLLTISSAGIPVAISKLVAENLSLGQRENAVKVFRTALLFLTLFGCLGSLMLFVAAGPLARLQGNPAAADGYRLLSPSILLVCVISAFRGYFQGKMNMAPTAVSQVLEQAVKMGLGIGLVRYALPDVFRGVAYAVAAVTVSELTAATYLGVRYFLQRERLRVPLRQSICGKTFRTVFFLSVPVTLSGLILPFTQLIDSVLVLRLIPLKNATSLYGLWTGPVHSLLNFPVVLTLGIATAVLPSVSRLKAAGNEAAERERSQTAFRLTVVAALPCAVGLFLLAKPIVKFLYGGLSEADWNVSAVLLQISAGSVLCLSVMQTATAILQGTGALYPPVRCLAIGTVLKILLNFLLIPLPQLHIYGAAIASVACYFVAGLLDFLYIIRKQKLHFGFADTVLKPLACVLAMTVGVLAFTYLSGEFLYTAKGTLLCIAFGGGIYLAAVAGLKVFDTKELGGKGFRKRKRVSQKSEDI